uniref:FAT domain-containing protein n=1 Tax=Glossina pallidipes TaxID=7398 RepID=A0A1A9ZYS7_GLOPL
MQFLEMINYIYRDEYLKHLCTYLGKTPNLWQRMTLVLEEMSAKQNVNKHVYMDCNEHQQDYNANQLTIYDSLSQMCSVLHEEDLWTGLWMEYAQYPETNVAICYEQMGSFKEAQGAYDLAMSKFKDDLSSGPCNTNMISEVMLWEQHWIRCAKELN